MLVCHSWFTSQQMKNSEYLDILPVSFHHNVPVFTFFFTHSKRFLEVIPLSAVPKFHDNLWW